MTTALGLPRSKFRSRSMRSDDRIAVSASSALTTSYTTGITCASNEIALVERITFSGLTLDSAANETITLKVNGHELPFHFASEADRRRSFRRVWRTNGNLVVHPGNTLQAKAKTASNSSIEIHYRRISYMKALQDGLLDGGGTLPNVASTNSITGSGLSAGTAKKIVNNTDYMVPYDTEVGGPFTIGETLTFGGGGTARLLRLDDGGTVGTITFQMLTGSVPADDETITGGTSSATAKVNGTPSSNTGRYIQILGFVYSGHGYNAAEDSARIGFWDGTTGTTFNAGANRFCKVYTRGATPEYAPDVWVGDTQGCIQGAQGWSVYVDATTNLAGATPTGDFVVLYRYINTKDVASATGGTGATTSGRRFWVYTEAAPTTGTTDSILLFSASGPSVDLHIKGQVGSFTCANETLGPNTVSLGLGTGTALPITGLHVMNSDAAAGTATVSSSFSEDDLDIRVNTGYQPSFVETMITAAGLTRAHVVWGWIGSTTSNQTGSAPANVNRFA